MAASAAGTTGASLASAAPAGAPNGPGGGRQAGDDGGSGPKWALAGFAATVVALLLFVAVPTVLITGQQNRCDATTIADGTADPVTLDQLQVAARIVVVGKEMDRPDRHIVAALAAGFVESELQNLPPERSDNDANPNKVSPGHVTSVGVFQQQELSTWTRNGRNRMNVRDAA